MPTVSFDKPQTEKAIVPTETGASPEPEQSSAVTVRNPSGFQIDGLGGEWQGKDLKPPRINLVQKVGPMSDSFNLGEWVLEKLVKIGGGGNPEVNRAFDNPIDVVVISARKQYQEVVKYGSEDFPEVLNSEAEVLDAGGTFEASPENYSVGNHGKRLFRPIAHVVLWVAKPEKSTEEMDAFFTMTAPDGSEGTLAVFSAANTSFKGVGQPIATAASTYARNNLTGFRWKLTAKKSVSNGNTYASAQLIPAGKTTPELAEFLKGFAH